MIELAADLPGPIAYVFGGGGSYGAVNVGQLRAMARTDVRPDFTVGTSVGSLHATIVSETPDTAGDRLAGFWGIVTRHDVFGSRKVAALNAAALRPGVADPGPLRDLIDRSLTARDFKDLTIPMTAVAVDVSTGHRADLRSGDVLSALMASVAIPGIFPIVERDGQRLMDGGLVANVPIGVAAEQGAQTIVVFDCGFNLFAPRTEPTLLHVMLRAAAIMTSEQVRRDLQQYSDRTIIYVPGKWPPASMPFDFSKTAENNEGSYAAALSFLRDLKVTGPGLYGNPPDIARTTA